MKKLILTGLSFLFAITLTFAQDANQDTKAKEKVAELTQVLTLDETQQTAIHAIVLEKLNAKAALKADTTLSAEDSKKQWEAIEANAHQKINEQLTDEQKVAFAKYKEENKDAKKEE